LDPSKRPFKICVIEIPDKNARLQTVDTKRRYAIQTMALEIGSSISGLGQVAPAGLTVFFGFFGLTLTGLRALTGFRAVAGVSRTGRRAIPAGAATGSGDLKNTRQPGLSSDFLLIMQTVTRSTSGMASLQRRNASPLHACCCSGV
jgi:hypothetical protein